MADLFMLVPDIDRIRASVGKAEGREVSTAEVWGFLIECGGVPTGGAWIVPGSLIELLEPGEVRELSRFGEGREQQLRLTNNAG